ncbi:MAG: DNA polymerase III subunit epsilon [Rhodospirillaceae bacterium]|nr:DNA polymerase III subunit epsilon [Rhodospirillaceae bacterium]OUU55502.1 MAG: DNA polymerase III subunit epsilon [Candidatus Endolissoclinum sp. TMED55]|tara:strand:- start:1196 stop:1870 length:675 start_codon:yes stop_codon:yes gene_type:complete
MREIVLDTETTGLDPKLGHRIVEIGAVELVNHIPTDNIYHCYINPEREVDQGAFEVHGLSTQFLSQFETFENVVDEFNAFIKGDPIIIHNAPFDIGFLNSELLAIGRNAIDENRIIDTLPMARQKFPGAQVNLNALCRKYNIDNSHRDLHGALVDADLLASVYLELIGGKQPGLGLANERKKQSITEPIVQKERVKRVFAVNETELEAHSRLLDSLANPIWRIE